VLPRADEAILYSKHIAPIFMSTCGGSGCHLNGDTAGGVAVDTWEKVMEGSADYGMQVVPYSARKSHFFQHINTDTTLSQLASPRMPLSRDPLTREELLAIKRWIDEGAKNDDGEVALADPTRARVFVAARNEGLVSVLDQSSGRVARYVDLNDQSTPGEEPYQVALSPDGSALYVSCVAAHMVKKVDARTLAPLGSVTIGGTPGQIAITRDGSKLYVANGDHFFAYQSIARIDAATMRLIDTIGPVGLGAQGIALSYDEHTLYTVNTEGDDVSIVDLATGTVTHRIPVSYNNPVPTGLLAKREPFFGVLDHSGRYLWVTCRKSGDVRVIDLEAGHVVDSLLASVRPLMAALTPDGRELWVPNEGTNSITIIDVASHATTTLEDINGGPQAVGFTADGRTAYVSCLSSDAAVHHGGTIQSGGLYMIRTNDRQVLRLVEIAAAAGGVAVGR
jgi:YVTN family beta-propeller protein